MIFSCWAGAIFLVLLLLLQGCNAHSDTAAAGDSLSVFKFRKPLLTDSVEIFFDDSLLCKMTVIELGDGKWRERPEIAACYGIGHRRSIKWLVFQNFAFDPQKWALGFPLAAGQRRIVVEYSFLDKVLKKEQMLFSPWQASWVRIGILDGENAGRARFGEFINSKSGRGWLEIGFQDDTVFCGKLYVRSANDSQEVRALFTARWVD